VAWIICKLNILIAIIGQKKAFPELQSERDVWYAVSIFHAYALSAACQAKNNPRYVDHALGLTGKTFSLDD